MTKTVSTDAIAPNAHRLLWAGFLAILAAGIGFGIRGGILATWAADFGFTGAQLGAIGGAGFTGFCFGIIIGGVVVAKSRSEAKEKLRERGLKATKLRQARGVMALLRWFDADIR